MKPTAFNVFSGRGGLILTGRNGWIASIVVMAVLLSGCNRSTTPSHPINPCTYEAYHYCVTVTRVSDGDSFRGLTEDGEEHRFRIYGIDAPEGNQPYGPEAGNFLRNLIDGHTVGIVQHTTDRWGRRVVWVFTPNGEDVSALLLQEGLAWHYKHFDDTPEYATYENEARFHRKGLWQDPYPTPPWEFRRR